LLLVLMQQYNEANENLVAKMLKKGAKVSAKVFLTD